MSKSISNPTADRPEKIANAAKVLGRSRDRKKVFLAIYKGKQGTKTVDDIRQMTGLRRMRILQEAKRLHNEDIIEQLPFKVNKDTAYRKIGFYSQNKKKIVSFADDRKKLEAFPTRINPIIQSRAIKITIPKQYRDISIRIKLITIDDIGSFSKAKIENIKLSFIPSVHLFYEREIKDGFKAVIGEKGRFEDWGGETDDLFSTRLILKGRRIPAAFAFKGKGTKGILTPRKMGKNGDQIQRLFKSPAGVFVIQYHSQISETVLDQMKDLALAKAVRENTTVYYGIIDGNDTARIIAAYKEFFHFPLSTPRLTQVDKKPQKA
jgi:hypothetical protein